MLEQVQGIQERVGTLVNWVSEMQTLVENPYSNGLNIPKVLKDLQGYAAELTKAVYALEKTIEDSTEPTEDVEIIEAE